MTERPRRSALYLPASNAKAIDKARTLDCDVVILDLEDAVAPQAKDMARLQAIEAIRAGGFGHRELVLRTNGLDTAWGPTDLEAACAAGPDAIVVPKINDEADVARYDAAIASAPAKTQLWAMIETSRALFHLEEISDAARRSRLTAWIMGVNDLAKETGARHTPNRAPFHAALGLAVAAARLNDLVVLDGVHNELEDDAGLEMACRQGADFGFDGKTLIHPRQIEACNRIFSPQPAEVAFARAVIAAFAQPENAGQGAIRVEGRMAERLHLAQAERLVAIDARITGLRAT